MPDILHDFKIKGTVADVFRGIATPEGLDTWWTNRAAGTPAQDQEFVLDFGPGYEWKAQITRYVTDREFELTMLAADKDWIGTAVGFELNAIPSGTAVSFRHSGWREANEHFRISSHCWAMYLRLLRRYVEFGEVVEYAERLDA